MPTRISTLELGYRNRRAGPERGSPWSIPDPQGGWCAICAGYYRCVHNDPLMRKIRNDATFRRIVNLIYKSTATWSECERLERVAVEHVYTRLQSRQEASHEGDGLTEIGKQVVADTERMWGHLRNPAYAPAPPKPKRKQHPDPVPALSKEAKEALAEKYGHRTWGTTNREEQRRIREFESPAVQRAMAHRSYMTDIEVADRRQHDNVARIANLRFLRAVDEQFPESNFTDMEYMPCSQLSYGHRIDPEEDL